MGRIYTEIISIGSINVYQVSADPNGILSAPIGSLAVNTSPSETYQNTDGGTTWALIGGSSVVFSNTRQIVPSLPAGDNSIFTTTGTDPKTFTLTAPEAITLQRIIFLDTQSAFPVPLSKSSQSFWVTRIEVVSGTGPNVGATLIQGDAVSGSVFAQSNVVKIPKLQLDLNAGDVVEVDVTALNQSTYPFSLTTVFDVGLSGANPLHFLTPAGGVLGAIGIGATAPVSATGTITVATLMGAGDTVSLNALWLGNGVGETSTGIGGTLTGVAGARTPGANDFDASLATTALLRDEILAALTDPLNNFAANWSFASSGASSITVTRSEQGPIGNSDTMATNTASIALVQMSGGSFAPVTATVTPPLAASTVECALFALTFPTQDNPPNYNFFPMIAGEITVNGGSTSAGPFSTPANMSEVAAITTDFAVAPGDVISVPVSGTVTATGFLALCSRV